MKFNLLFTYTTKNLIDQFLKNKDLYSFSGFGIYTHVVKEILENNRLIIYKIKQNEQKLNTEYGELT